jgi:hypothetical protein
VPALPTCPHRRLVRVPVRGLGHNRPCR